MLPKKEAQSCPASFVPAEYHPTQRYPGCNLHIEITGAANRPKPIPPVAPAAPRYAPRHIPVYNNNGVPEFGSPGYIPYMNAIAEQQRIYNEQRQAQQAAHNAKVAAYNAQLAVYNKKIAEEAAAKKVAAQKIIAEQQAKKAEIAKAARIKQEAQEKDKIEVKQNISKGVVGQREIFYGIYYNLETDIINAFKNKVPGIDIQMVDHCGQSILDHSLYYGQEKLAQYLINDGADATSRRWQNRDSAWYAEHSTDPEMKNKFPKMIKDREEITKQKLAILEANALQERMRIEAARVEAENARTQQVTAQSNAIEDEPKECKINWQAVTNAIDAEVIPDNPMEFVMNISTYASGVTLPGLMAGVEELGEQIVNKNICKNKRSSDPIIRSNALQLEKNRELGEEICRVRGERVILYGATALALGGLTALATKSPVAAYAVGRRAMLTTMIGTAMNEEGKRKGCVHNKKRYTQ